MAEMRPDGSPPMPDQQPNRPTNNWLRTAILVAVGIYVLVLVSPLVGRISSTSSKEITYSQLKTQVANDNVKDLVIQGQDAHGDFKAPVQGYSQFTAHVAEAGGDPSFYTLLDQHNVSYDTP